MKINVNGTTTRGSDLIPYTWELDFMGMDAHAIAIIASRAIVIDMQRRVRGAATIGEARNLASGTVVVSTLGRTQRTPADRVRSAFAAMSADERAALIAALTAAETDAE